MELAQSNNLQELNDTWVFMGHLPHDSDWSLRVINYYKLNKVNEAISLTNK